MNLRESALVAFTLLIESSVGIVLIAAALHLFAPRASVHETSRALQLPLLAAVAAAVLGLLASFAHLGQPLNAWLAITNVRTSWLSREIVLAVLFAASAAVVGVLFRSGGSSIASRTAWSLVAAGLGAATVYAMSRVYMVDAQPAWNRLVTPVSFFATTVILGAVAVRLAVGGMEPQARWLAVLAMTLLGVQLLLLPAQIAALAREPAAAVSAASIGTSAAWLAAGKAAAAVAATLLLALLVRGADTLPVPAATLGGAALALAALSETLGRVLFYASSVHLGRV